MPSAAQYKFRSIQRLRSSVTQTRTVRAGPARPSYRAKDMKQAIKDEACRTCILRWCDEQSLHCTYRLLTKPNWLQKRKIADERRMVRKIGKKIDTLKAQILALETDRETRQRYINREPKLQFGGER